MVTVNIYYQGHIERIEIDMIGEQKQSMILSMPWLAHHNLEIDWKTGEVKMMKCPEECERQQRLKQEKSGWQTQKEEEKKREEEDKQEEKESQKKKKTKGSSTVEIKRVAKEQEIWDEEEKVAKLEVKTKKLVPKKFHKQIKVFNKKQSKRIPTRKIWDHVIELKK